MLEGVASTVLTRSLKPDPSHANAGQKAGSTYGPPGMFFCSSFGSDSLLEEVPGVGVGGEGAACGTVGGEAEAGAAVEDGDGEDVPGVLGDEVDDEEVDLGGEVGDKAWVGGDGVGAGGLGVGSAAAGGIEVTSGFDVVAAFGVAGGGGFDLDATEAAAVVDDEVVASGLAEGPGNQ